MRYSLFFQYVSRNSGPTNLSLPQNKWPEEWKVIYFKTYPRLQRIDLNAHIRPIEISLSEALRRRVSSRDFSQRAVSLPDLANLFFYSAGIHKDFKRNNTNTDWSSTRRPYPSGGARYPLEIYLLVLKEDGRIERGVYHYNVKENSLERLGREGLLNGEKFNKALLSSWSAQAPVIVLVTAVFERSQVKYGERGYRLILQETGHLGQNFSLVSEALGLGCCAVSGYNDELMDEILDIDGFYESTVYAFVIGHKRHRQSG